MFFVDSAALGQPMHWALFGPVLKTYAEGSFKDLLTITIWDAPLAKWAFMLESGRLSTILGMSILGFLLGKIDLLRNIESHLKKIKIFFALSSALTIILQLGNFYFSSLLNANENWIK